MTTIQAALSGALLGALHALMAAGVSVTWGVLRIINLAHFGMMLIGAYLTFELASDWQIDPLLTLLVSIPAMALLGAVLQWAFDALRISELNSLLLSFGLLIIVVQSVSTIWSADFQRMSAAVNPYATDSVPLGPLAFPVPTLLAFAVASAAVLGGHAVLRGTFLGRALRAHAEDRAVAAAFGVDHRRIAVMLAAVTGGSAAVAGMLFSLGNALTPATAFEWFGTVFAVVILGGVGHLLGTFAAGLFVGVLSSVVSVVLSPAAAPFVLFSAIVLALLLRPQGLFAVGAAR
jgi:branched-chain amino acid transport system permease protein